MLHVQIFFLLIRRKSVLHVQFVFLLIRSVSLEAVTNSQQACAQGVKIPRKFAFLAVRHMAICGKIVAYISGHSQFDVASAISDCKKILPKNISPFGTVKKESENIWIC